jgi:DNA-binding NtrC family response regulator
MAEESAHILVVDDELELRELLAQVLESEGFRVSQAPGGRIALEILKQEKVDLVISDLRMPDGGGVELLKTIKSINSQLPLVIMITGFSDMPESQIIKLGAHAMLLKPFDTDVFSAVVRDAVKLVKSKSR